MNTVLRKNLLVIFCCCSISYFSFSQDRTPANSFHFESVQDAALLSSYEAIFTSGNFESYRLKNQEVILSFQDGVTCVLLPALEVYNAEISGSYAESFPEGFVLPQFYFNQSGGITAVYPKISK